MSMTDTETTPKSTSENGLSAILSNLEQICGSIVDLTAKAAELSARLYWVEMFIVEKEKQSKSGDGANE